MLRAMRPITLPSLLLASFCGLVSAPGAMAQEAASAAGSTPLRIAVVDLELIVGQSKDGQALRQRLKDFQTQVETEGRQKAEALQDLRRRLAEGANALSEDKLTELQKSYEDAGIDLRRFESDKEREAQKMYNEGLKEIETRLEPVFRKVRDEGGYDIILNNVAGVVVMVSERVDITQQVLARLNEGG